MLEGLQVSQGTLATLAGLQVSQAAQPLWRVRRYLRQFGHTRGVTNVSGSDPAILAVWALVQVRNTILMTQLGAMNRAIG